jgi:hypothetical protein
MKKIYAAILFTIAALGVNAQCTPDNNLTQPGYYPDRLDTAQIGVQYAQVLQLRIPKDTNVVFAGQNIKADIDSIKLVNVVGLPSGFTYQCNVSSCTFTPSQTYCAKISGNPTQSQTGNYPLQLAVVAYAHGNIFGVPTTFPPQPDTIDRFTLVVGAGGPSAVAKITTAYGVKVYPNPATNEATIWANTNYNETLTYTLSDVAGKVYKTETLLNTNGLQTAVVNLNGLAKGFYFVQVSGEQGTSTTKLLVE